MGRRTFRLRWFAFLWAALQLALPTGMSLADARLAAESSPASVAHAEDRTGAQCRQVHGQDCAICQAISQTIAAPRAPETPCAAGRAAHVPALQRVVSVAALPAAAPPARAPPAA